MRLTPWAMAYSSSRLVPSTFTSCRTSGSPRKWRTKAWWTTASGRSVRNTSSNLRLRMSTTCMRTSAGWPSHGVRSTPMIRQRAPAMRRAMSRPWPPAIPVISTVSIGSATALGGSNAGATRADAAASAKWKSCSGPSTGARAIGGGILILPSGGRNTRGPGGDGAAAPFGVVADRRGHELPRPALQQPRPRRADLQHHHEVGPDHGPGRALELDLQARPAAAGQRRRSPDRGDEDLVCERPRQDERQSAVHRGERHGRPVQRPAEDPAAGNLPALTSAALALLPVCETGQAFMQPRHAGAPCRPGGAHARRRSACGGEGTEPSRACAVASVLKARYFAAHCEARRSRERRERAAATPARRVRHGDWTGPRQIHTTDTGSVVLREGRIVKRSNRAQGLRTACLGLVALIVLGASAAGAAGDPDFGAVRWVALDCAPGGDPAGDESPSSADLVGDPSHPATYYAYDATYLYFRYRLDSDPTSKGGFVENIWSALMQVPSGNP